MKKFKRLIVMIMCLILTIPSLTVSAHTTNIVCSTNNYQTILIDSINFEEILVNSINFQEDANTIHKLYTSKNILKHNNGKPIETNIFTDNQSEGNYVIAAFYTIVDGVPCETVYFSNKDNLSKDDLMNIVNEDSTRSYNINTTMDPRTGYIRNYNWTFYYGVQITAKLTSSVSLTRCNSTTNIDGTIGSVWNIVSTT